LIIHLRDEVNSDGIDDRQCCYDTNDQPTPGSTEESGKYNRRQYPDLGEMADHSDSEDHGKPDIAAPIARQENSAHDKEIAYQHIVNERTKQGKYRISRVVSLVSHAVLKHDRRGND
jgi:hypothetical protein